MQMPSGRTIYIYLLYTSVQLRVKRLSQGPNRVSMVALGFKLIDNVLNHELTLLQKKKKKVFMYK